MTIELISANTGIPMGKAKPGGGGDVDETGLYRYMGSVATYDDLLDLDTINFKPGYVYDVQEDGMDYSWTGTTWNALGTHTDLSNYYTKPEVNSALADKQNKLTGINAGTGINIYDFYPDAVAVDYHVMNSSQQLVSYTVADESAWTSVRGENPRGISLTDVVDNIANKAFEYVALVPYSDGAGISLRLVWDYDVSMPHYTDGISFHEPTSSSFTIRGAYYKSTYTIQVTPEQYLQIQEQGGVWFKITSNGSGEYHAYYSFDKEEWTEVIFVDDSGFSPELTPICPCIGCTGSSYASTATFNLEAASFTFTPVRDPYTKIEVNESNYYTQTQINALLQAKQDLIDALTTRVTALETNINGGNA